MKTTTRPTIGRPRSTLVAKSAKVQGAGACAPGGANREAKRVDGHRRRRLAAARRYVDVRRESCTRRRERRLCAPAEADAASAPPPPTTTTTPMPLTSISPKGAAPRRPRGPSCAVKVCPVPARWWTAGRSRVEPGGVGWRRAASMRSSFTARIRLRRRRRPRSGGRAAARLRSAGAARGARRNRCRGVGWPSPFLGRRCPPPAGRAHQRRPSAERRRMKSRSLAAAAAASLFRGATLPVRLGRLRSPPAPTRDGFGSALRSQHPRHPANARRPHPGVGFVVVPAFVPLGEDLDERHVAALGDRLRGVKGALSTSVAAHVHHSKDGTGETGPCPRRNLACLPLRLRVGRPARFIESTPACQRHGCARTSGEPEPGPCAAGARSSSDGAAPCLSKAPSTTWTGLRHHDVIGA